MEKESARKQTLEQLHERREQVVRLYKAAMGIMKIVELTGLTCPTVRSAIECFEKGGWEALKPKARGRLRGTGRVLSVQQERLNQEQIRCKRPEQLGVSSFLWSRAAVGELIEREYGIQLQVRSIGKYLTRWGLTPQKPIKRAYEQDREAVHAWMQGTYPGIQERARREGAEIHRVDETALTNTDVRGRSFAPAGHTPVALSVGSGRHKLSMIASVTNQGKARWMIIEQAFNADRFCEFLHALIQDADKKVFLIVDNLRVHHSKQVKAWVDERTQHIELFYLPRYSPQLNSEERFNADLKQAQ